MGSITTVILDPSDDSDAVAELNRRLSELATSDGRGADYWSLGPISDQDEQWGGTKRPPALHGGALNHLPWPDFCRTLSEVDWIWPGEVRLIVQRPERSWQVMTLADIKADASV